MSDAVPAGGLGATLRDARLAKGLELAEVADRTHVRTSYLEALEAEDWAALPEDVYARNFLRLYAKAVGVDAEEALARFDAARHGAARSTRATRGDGRATESGAAPTRTESDAAARPRRPRRAPPATPAAGTPREAPAARRGPALPPNLMPLLMTLVLAGALVGVAVWGFNRLLFRPEVPATRADAPAAEGDASPGGADGGAPAPQGGGLAAPVLPGGDDMPAEILLTVESEPSGAEVSVDAFPLPGTTPIEGVPVTAREERTVRVVRDGFEPYEGTFDMTTDRTLTITLEPEATAADADPDADAAAPAGDAGVVVEVLEATWLEAYGSTARGEGERLVYTTAQPGERFEFTRPLYLHVGNAGGLEVTVDGEPFGPLGSGGAVTGQAFPAP